MWLRPPIPYPRYILTFDLIREPSGEITQAPGDRQRAMGKGGFFRDKRDTGDKIAIETNSKDYLGLVLTNPINPLHPC